MKNHLNFIEKNRSTGKTIV